MAGSKENDNPIVKILRSGLLAPLLYLLLITIWNLAIYGSLIAMQISKWPLCWDFIHYYQCGAMALSPDRFHVYDPQLQLAWTNKLINPVHVDELWFIQFVPFVFPLMTVFALLPIKVCYPIWCLISIALGTTALVAVSTTGFRSPLARAGLCLAALACFPAWMNTWWGQFAWFYVCLLGFFFVSMKGKNDVRAGVLLSLLSIKPQYIPYLLVPPLVSRKWKLLAVAAASELALFALSILVIGWDSVIHYPLTLLSAEKQTGIMQVNAADMVSIRGPLSLVLPEKLVLGVSFLLNLAAFPLIWILWKKALNSKNSIGTNWAMAITILAMIVLSPHSHAYDCLFLMLAAALTLPAFKLTELFNQLWAHATKQIDEDPQSKTGESNIGLAGKIAYKFWMGSLYFYPVLSWILFFPLNDFNNKLYPKAYAMLDMMILAAGLICIFEFADEFPTKDKSK